MENVQDLGLGLVCALHKRICTHGSHFTLCEYFTFHISHSTYTKVSGQLADAQLADCQLTN